MLGNFDALLLQVGDEFVALLDKIKEREIREARTQPLLESRLLVRNSPVSLAVAHGRAWARRVLAFCSAGRRPVTFQTS
jgi:hypothetical protein